MSSAERKHWFAFSPMDFLRSRHVRRMGAAERGAYITLICESWIDGGLPSDIAVLALLAGTDEKTMRGWWAGPLGKCWEEGEDGLLYNARLEHERAIADGISESKAKAGKASGEARRRKAGVRTETNTCSTPVEQNRPSVEPQTGTRTETKTKTPDQNQTQKRAGARDAPAALEFEVSDGVHFEASGASQAESDSNLTEPEKVFPADPQRPQTGRKAPAKVRPWQALLVMDPLASLPDLREAWTMYNENRADLGLKPWTARTCNLVLTKYPPAQLAAALIEAVEEGWHGPQYKHWTPDGQPKGGHGHNGKVSARQARGDAAIEAFESARRAMGPQPPKAPPTIDISAWRRL